LRTNNKPKQATSEKSIDFDFIFLDTAGTELPCHQGELDDKRATQYFLRDTILHLASRVVFVTTKFDQEIQTTISDLIRQLTGINKKVTPNNRLIIVHNMIDITTEEDLKKKNSNCV